MDGYQPVDGDNDRASYDHRHAGILAYYFRAFVLHYMLLLLMESSIIGVFLALDLFLFYLFWEVMLIPMFFLIGIWGHGRKIYSAVKFFIFTLAGSLLMLLAIIGIYLIHGSQTGIYTFNLNALIGTKLDPTVGYGFTPHFC